MRQQVTSAYTKRRLCQAVLLDRIENTLTRQMWRERKNKDRGSDSGTTDTHGEDDSGDDIFGNVGDYVPSHEPTGDSGAGIN
jgi:hypothetical protein